MKTEEKLPHDPGCGATPCGAAASQDRACPSLSLVVPVWNVEKFLPVCLASIQAQTFTDWECILVDDGSPDGSGKICDDYAARDSRFKVIHQENSGVSAARNRGMEAARGRYLAFCDSDDQISPRQFEAVMEIQRQYPDRAVLWNFTRVRTDLEPAGEAPPPVLLRTRWQMDTLAKDTPALFGAVWNKLFDRERMLAHDLWFDENMGGVELDFKSEDADFARRYYEECFPGPVQQLPMAYCPLPLYCWSVENESSLLHRLIRLRAQEGQTVDGTCAPEPGYLSRILEECRQRVCQDPDFWNNPPRVIARSVVHYFRCIGYGLWSAKQLGEPLPSLREMDALPDMLAWCARQRLFTPYWLPLRLGRPGAAAWLYGQDQDRTAWYFRYCQLLRLTLLRGWKDAEQFPEVGPEKEG